MIELKVQRKRAAGTSDLTSNCQKWLPNQTLPWYNDRAKSTTKACCGDFWLNFKPKVTLLTFSVLVVKSTTKTHNGQQWAFLLHLHGNQLIPLGKECLLLDGGGKYLLPIQWHNAEWVTETCNHNTECVTETWERGTQWVSETCEHDTEWVIKTQEHNTEWVTETWEHDTEWVIETRT